MQYVYVRVLVACVFWSSQSTYRETYNQWFKHEKKRKEENSDDDESEDDHPKKKSAREQRDEKLKKAVENLNENNGSNYTPIQYRIWSALYANGMHTDLDKPPNNSMFKKAGSNTPSAKKKQSDSTSPEMAQALTQAAT